MILTKCFACFSTEIEFCLKYFFTISLFESFPWVASEKTVNQLEFLIEKLITVFL